MSKALIAIAFLVIVAILVSGSTAVYAHHKEGHTANCKNFPVSDFCQPANEGTDVSEPEVESTALTAYITEQSTKIQNRFGQVSEQTDDGTVEQRIEFTIPDTNLSDKQIKESDPSLRYIEYHSLYDIIRSDPHGTLLIIFAAEKAGIDWNGLSEAQQAYLILYLRTLS